MSQGCVREKGKTTKHRRRKRRNNETSNRNYDEGKDVKNRADSTPI
jgi:hypothetical protein